MSKKSTRAKETKLAFESLEKKMMLAGTVQAFLHGHTLVISGDGFGNGVAITQAAGAVQVEGLTTAGGATTIAGAGSFAGVEKIQVNLEAGDDLLTMGSLNITTKTVAATGVSVGREIKIDGGSGMNTIMLTNVTAGRNLEVKTGSEASIVLLDQVHAGRGLEVKTGSADDFLGVVAVSAARKVEFKAGDGNNTIAASSVVPDITLALLGDATHPGYVTGNAVFEPIFAPLSGDLDTLLSDIAGTSPTSVSARKLKIRTGDGADNVLVNGASVSKRIKVKLGRGDDNLAFTANSAPKTKLDGGRGTNRLFLADNTGTVDWRHFLLG